MHHRQATGDAENGERCGDVLAGQRGRATGERPLLAASIGIYSELWKAKIRL